MAYFAEHRITRIERLTTGNAFAYRYSRRTVCANHDITQKFTNPQCPSAEREGWSDSTAQPPLSRLLST